MQESLSGVGKHGVAIVIKYHLCLSTPSNSLWEALEMKAWSPDTFMKVTSVKVSDEDGSVKQHDDQSKEHHHE